MSDKQDDIDLILGKKFNPQDYLNALKERVRMYHSTSDKSQIKLPRIGKSTPKELPSSIKIK